MARATETVRLVYHARTLVIAAIGIAGVLAGIAVAGGDIGRSQLGPVAVPLLAVTLGVLAFLVWLGWNDYVSATSLAIDERGVTLGRGEGSTVPWSAIRALSRGTGAFRLVVRTEAKVVRFQLLVLPRPIAALKMLVARAKEAGAKVEPYLERLAEHVDEEEPEEP